MFKLCGLCNNCIFPTDDKNKVPRCLFFYLPLSGEHASCATARGGVTSVAMDGGGPCGLDGRCWRMNPSLREAIDKLWLAEVGPDGLTFDEGVSYAEEGDWNCLHTVHEVCLRAIDEHVKGLQPPVEAAPDTEDGYPRKRGRGR